jgi:hypothetical protein
MSTYCGGDSGVVLEPGEESHVAVSQLRPDSLSARNLIARVSIMCDRCRDISLTFA